MRKLKTTHRKGNVLIYATLGAFTFMGMTSLAVDYGHAQLARTEMQSTADAAARYAITGLYNNINGSSAAPDMAAAVVQENKIDGTYASINKSRDVEYGTWNSTTHVFIKVTDPDQANAVRVTIRRTVADGNAISMPFRRVLGMADPDMVASSIAVMDYGNGIGNGPGNGFAGSTSGTGNVSQAGKGVFEYYIPATSNPWLSGMPKGSVAGQNNPANNPDYAGDPFTDLGIKKTNYGQGNLGLATNGIAGSDSNNLSTSANNWAKWGDYASKKGSPIQAGSVTIQSGTSMTFDGVSGGASNDPNISKSSGDGDINNIASNYNGSENGISNVRAPINSMVAVFLDNAQPNTASGSVPETLDFSTPDSRNYLTLQPKLRQVFYIGDGRTDNGDVQHIIAPAGATRMYIATMDGYEWNNNAGGFQVRMNVVGRVITVK